MLVKPAIYLVAVRVTGDLGASGEGLMTCLDSMRCFLEVGCESSRKWQDLTGRCEALVLYRIFRSNGHCEVESGDIHRNRDEVCCGRIRGGNGYREI